MVVEKEKQTKIVRPVNCQGNAEVQVSEADSHKTGIFPATCLGQDCGIDIKFSSSGTPRCIFQCRQIISCNKVG